MDTDIIFKYFDSLSDLQKRQFTAMGPVYAEWNEKINVISRKDICNLYEHHVLHSLAIAKIADFADGSEILDLGCGGGFPGIPLAVMFPRCRFTLCDSVGKKIRVAEAAASGIGLENVRTENCRAEDLKGAFDYIVTRSVASFDTMLPWINGKWKSGIIALKGGNVFSEIDACINKCGLKTEGITVFNISDFFEEDYFFEKKIVFIGR